MAYSRGPVVVALSNSVMYQEAHVSMPEEDFKEGDVLCNAMKEKKTDCKMVYQGKMIIELPQGESKIYIPENSKFWDSEEYLNGFNTTSVNQE